MKTFLFRILKWLLFWAGLAAVLSWQYQSPFKQTCVESAVFVLVLVLVSCRARCSPRRQ
jgi:CHASE2 domain-containing sensor protein